MDIRQSDEYAQFMESIGWKVKTIDGVNAFIRHFPLIGSFIKIQRVSFLPSLTEIHGLIEKERAFKIVIEPTTNCGVSELENHSFCLATPYAPSKTIQIGLTPTLDKIFSSFGKTARWTIKKAEKNGIVIKEGLIDEFIKLKTKGFLFLQNSFSSQIRELYKAFSPEKAKILIAYLRRSHLVQGETLTKIPVAGVFLLFHDQVAYYWMAAATKEGKELATPSLLVWEAVKLAKEKGCTIFDFEGVFDERFPKQTNSWRGFTKFKEGFGGKKVYLPCAIGKSFILCFRQK